MKSKGLLALILVVGLVLMAGSAKAANSMSDNVPGNGAFAYFYATPDCISTLVAIFNIDTTANWIHIIAKDQDSKHVWDADLCLTHKGTAVLMVYADANGIYINGIGGEAIGQINNEKLFMTPDENGAYMGYINVVAVSPDKGTNTATACSGAPVIGQPVGDDPLVVTTALVQSNWWVGINAAMVQRLTDPDVDDLTGDVGTSMLAGRECVTLYGRWYDDPNTRGNLVLVFPVGMDNTNCFVGTCPEETPYPITGYSYDENQNRRSFTRCVKEANMIPFGTVLPDVGSGSGWVEIDNTTASAFGYVIVENGLQADAAPLFKKGESGSCPTCETSE